MTRTTRVTMAVAALASAAVVGWSGALWAGPVILGGDDLTDHGDRVGGANVEGWLYIEKAISNLNTNQTRPGPITVDIAALGSADPGAGNFPGPGNAGGAINSAADVLGLSLSFFDGAAAINTFFSDLTGGSVNPKILWLAGTGAGNDLDGLEGAALTANAAAINSFVASGGGLMAHGSGTTAYGWLTALLPGLTETSGCNSSGATLTAAGNAAFPGLSNSDVDANAGPCHSHFEGNFGGLVTLAFDGADPARSYIIGTGAGGLIVCGQPGQPACPPPPGTGVVPEPASLLLLGSGFTALAGWRLLRRRRLS